jgi:hypothetical protein
MGSPRTGPAALKVGYRSVMHNETEVEIRAVREADAASFCEAVAAVAAEKWYLATVDGFSLEQTSAFVKHVVSGSLPQVMALADTQVVGFCDILPGAAKGFTHVGRLGMGVRSEWRPFACTSPLALAKKARGREDGNSRDGIRT